MLIQPHLEERRRRQREYDEEQEMLERAMQISLHEYENQYEHDRGQTSAWENGMSGTGTGLRHRRRASQASAQSNVRLASNLKGIWD